MRFGGKDTLAPRRLSRHSLAGALVVAALVGLVALLADGGGATRRAAPASVPARTLSPATAAAVRPPAATAAKSSALGGSAHVRATRHGAAPANAGTVRATPAVTGAPGTVAVGGAQEVPDPEAGRSFPAPATIHHAAAAAPSAAASAAVASGAPSDAEIRRELKQMAAVQQAAQQPVSPAGGAGDSIGGAGTWTPPPNVPAVVARVIAGGNAIADFPYRFGGGHASFVDNAYDCSASVSYALAAGGMISAPVTSGQLENWGVPGPGRWITVYANAGHTYMYVNGMRFDTSGRSGVFGSRWQPASRNNVGFVARHWPGL